MRLFLDTNLVRYIGTHQGYVFETEESDDLAAEQPLMREQIDALWAIFKADERAHFEFVISPGVLGEIMDSPVGEAEGNIVSLLLEHSRDLAEQEGWQYDEVAVRRIEQGLKEFTKSQCKDRRLLAEAIFFECDVFLTNDLRLVKKAGGFAVRPLDFWESIRRGL